METIRDKIRQAKDIESEMIWVPEWDVTVEVRSISGTARARLFANASDKAGKVQADQAYVNLVIEATYDPDSGDKIFTQDDIGWLSEKSAKAMERVAKVASRLAGISESSLKEAEKNSSAGTQS